MVTWGRGPSSFPGCATPPGLSALDRGCLRGPRSENRHHGTCLPQVCPAEAEHGQGLRGQEADLGWGKKRQVRAAPCLPGHPGWGTQVVSAQWTQPWQGPRPGLWASEGLCSSARGEATVASDGVLPRSARLSAPALPSELVGGAEPGQVPFAGSPPADARGLDGLQVCKAEGVRSGCPAEVRRGVRALYRPAAQAGKLHPLWGSGPPTPDTCSPAPGFPATVSSVHKHLE